MKKNVTNEQPTQWYIVTAVSGNEDSIVANLWNKIKAYGYENKVDDIKVIKEKKVNIEYFSQDNAPSVMKKSKNITWETIETPNHKTQYKKTKVEEMAKLQDCVHYFCERVKGSNPID